MGTTRYEPERNGIQDLKKGDWPGWYEIVYVVKSEIKVSVRWWSGTRWKFQPNERRCSPKPIEVYDKVLGITRLVSE